MSFNASLPASLALLVWAAGALAAPLPDGAVRVIDGDTFALGATRVRLHGLDAPELDQTCTSPSGQTWACGLWARARLDALLRGQRPRCEAVETDRYGRIVARCVVAGQDLGARLVAEGAATAYRRYSTAYVAQEAAARRDGLGLWAAGPQVSPQEHRQRPKVVASPPPQQAGCRIKGNIGASGHVYHMPGQRDYDATRINTRAGERWFCSEDEARRAGFRPARR